MSKIPSAEDFLQDKLSEIHDKEIFEDLLQKMFTVDVSDVMKEFARLHVEAALKEALESIPCLGSSSDIASYEEVEDAVLTAYPLENIK